MVISTAGTRFEQNLPKTADSLFTTNDDLTPAKLVGTPSKKEWRFTFPQW